MASVPNVYGPRILLWAGIARFVLTCHAAMGGARSVLKGVITHLPSSAM